MLRIISIICACLGIYILLGTAGTNDMSIFGTTEISITDIIQNFFIVFVLLCISYVSEFMYRALKK